jgi:predicted peptidase
VVSGWIAEFRCKTTGILYSALAPATVSDPYAYVAKQVSALPIWIFHSDAGKTVSVEESRNMAKALKAIGADVQYTEFSGVDHNGWDPAYDRADLIQWIFKQSRKQSG